MIVVHYSNDNTTKTVEKTLYSTYIRQNIKEGVSCASQGHLIFRHFKSEVHLHIEVFLVRASFFQIYIEYGVIFYLSQVIKVNIFVL